MNAKRRLAWIAVLIFLLLGSLFLPGVRNTLFHRIPDFMAKQNGQAGKNAASSLPGSANQAGTGSADSALSLGEMNPFSRSTRFRVIDVKDGRGIEGAMLHPSEQQPSGAAVFSPSQWVTDHDGYCSLILSPGFFVTVTAAGYLSHTAIFDRVESMHDEYVFKLEKGAPVGGTVQNETGQAIANVEVLVHPQYRSALPAKLPKGEYLMSVIAKTDTSGRWHAQNVPLDPDASIVIQLNHPEYIEAIYMAEQPFQAADSTSINSIEIAALLRQDAVFTLKEGFVVVGSVCDERGNPIQSAAITGGELNETKTGSDGRFSFASSKRAEVVMIARAQGFAPASQRVRIEPKMAPIQFRLAKGNVIAGRVVDESGKPVSNASISTVNSEQQLSQEYFNWHAKSDIDGRFLWDSAPAFPMNFSVTAEGYQNPNPREKPYFLLQPGQENEVRLRKLSGIRVTAKVFDQKTNQPIDNFRVVTLSQTQAPGRPSTPKIVTGAVEVANGESTLNLIDRSNPNSNLKVSYSIRIEAQGYMPNTSPEVDLSNGDQTLGFAMVRGDGIRGIVKLADGRPAAGAKVSLFGLPHMPLSMSNSDIQRYNSGAFSESVTADDEGRFSLNPMPEAHTIVAVHEKGLVTEIPPKPGTSCTLVLQLWGRIEGKVKVGNRDADNQSVRINSLISPTFPPDISATFSGKTDGQGRFVIEKVPPQEYKVSSGDAFSTVIVRAGQTASVTVGGMGRPVVGRFVMADPEAKVPPSGLRASLSRIRPSVRIPGTNDEAAYRAWMESEEGRQFLLSAVNYQVQTSDDGSFRVEDVAAGKYELSITSANFRREVMVPEMPGGRSDEPLNLGIITLSLQKNR
jgi:hypothetical protein